MKISLQPKCETYYEQTSCSELCGGSRLEAELTPVWPPNCPYIWLGIHQKSLYIRAAHRLLLTWNEVLQPFAQLIPSGSRKWESNWVINLPMAGFHHREADSAVCHSWIRLRHWLWLHDKSFSFRIKINVIDKCSQSSWVLNKIPDNVSHFTTVKNETLLEKDICLLFFSLKQQFDLTISLL